MEKVKKIVNRIFNKHYYYDFKFDENILHILTIVFLKSISDIFKTRLYELAIVPLLKQKNIGARLDSLFTLMPSMNDFLLPRFDVLSDDLATSIIDGFSTIDFAKKEYFSEDVMTYVYETLTQCAFTGSANTHMGEFFTPPDICRAMVKMIKVDQPDDQEISVYDGCCGTGALLVSFMQANPTKKIKVYGQDLNKDSVAICKMNVRLHKLKTKKQQSNVYL